MQNALVVDDSPRTQKMLSRAASRSGFAPHVVGSAEAALAFLNAHDAPAVILVDISLPRMSAFALATALRAAGCSATIIVTGERAGMELDDAVRALEVGVDHAPTHKDLAATLARVSPAVMATPSLWQRFFGIEAAAH
jgi:DNA-binding response OmpR family regulator